MVNRKMVKEGLLQLADCVVRRGSCMVIFATALMVLATGLWMAQQSGQDVDLQMRRDLVRQATDIAAAVNPFDLGLPHLSFSADDKTRPVFQRLSAQMRDYAAFTGVKSVYTMALRNGQIVFGPESLPEGHPYASPPGTVYQKPTQKDFDIFTTGRTQVQGPAHDEYGTFVTASAPVSDPYTGEVVAGIGIDVDASAWRAAVRRAQWIPIQLTLVLLLILLISGLVIRYRQRHSPQRKERKRYSETILSAVFLSLMTLAVVNRVSQAERESRYNSFYQQAQTYVAARVKEFNNLQDRIDQLVSFFKSSEDVSRAEFDSYCSTIVQKGVVTACVWLPAVKEADIPLFIQKARTARWPDFSVWQKNTNGLNEPVAFRPVYYPALYIAPLAGHETAVGYDLNSEPVRNAALQEALRTGLPTATDPIRFIALTNSPLGFFIFQPVNASIQKGLTAFAVRPENLLGEAPRHNKKTLGIQICLFQLQPRGESLFIAGSCNQCGPACFEDAASGLGITVPVFRFGKAYAIRLIPDRVWLADHPLRNGKIVGIVGLLITILVSSLVTTISNRHYNLEKQIEVYTVDLRASETKFRLLTTLVPAGIYLTGTDGRCQYANPYWCRQAGLNLEEALGYGWIKGVHPEDREAVFADWHKMVESEGQWGREYRFLTGDGKVSWVYGLATPQRDAAGRILGYVGINMDITDRKRAEEALQKANNLLSETGEMGRVGAWEFDIETGKQAWTEEVYRIHELEFTCQPTVELGVSFYTPESRLVIERAVQRASELGEPYDLELEMITAKGGLRHVHTVGKADLSRRKVFGFFQDITDRKQAEERIRQLAQHLEVVREDERKRLSRELHDDIGQILTAIKIDLVVIKDECTCAGEVKDKMRDMQNLLSEGVQCIHTLCRRLRPGALDDLGLEDALAGLIDDWKQRNHVACEFRADMDDESLSDEIRTTVFRMVQEALTNVSRYASASKIEINLVADEQTVHVSIADNGCGMEAGAESKPTSFGLLGMRERIEALGGELFITSALGKGTRIEGSIPLKAGGGGIEEIF